MFCAPGVPLWDGKDTGRVVFFPAEGCTKADAAHDKEESSFLTPWPGHLDSESRLPRWLSWSRTHLPIQETQAMWAGSLGQKEPFLEEKMATHCSILVWRIPRTEEPGGLQSMGSQKVRHDWVINTFTFFSFQFSISLHSYDFTFKLSNVLVNKYAFSLDKFCFFPL